MARPTTRIRFTLSKEAYSKLAEKAEALFEPTADAAARSIVTKFLEDPDSELPGQPSELDRKRYLENQLLENRLKKDSREWVPLASFVDLVSKDWAVIKSMLEQLPNVPSGLTDEQRAEIKAEVERTFETLQSTDATNVL